MQVAIRSIFLVYHDQSFRRGLAAGFGFVNVFPALFAVDKTVVKRNLAAFAVGIANLQQALDFQVLRGSRQSEFRRQRLALGVGRGTRVACGLRQVSSQKREDKEYRPNGHLGRKASGKTWEI